MDPVVNYKGDLINVSNIHGDGFFESMPPYVIVFFALIIGIIIFRIFMGVHEWSSNNQQMVVRIPAKVVAKRDEVYNHRNHMSSATSYFVTFEDLETGDRSELEMGGQEYGLLATGDEGTLTRQGTRYHGFQRQRG